VGVALGTKDSRQRGNCKGEEEGRYPLASSIIEMQ
jgi:hypothetical protein